MPAPPLPRVHLVRHGETEWSRAGRHTGTTELPLSARGEEEARALASVLGRTPFAAVLTSPRARARRTCELAGLGSSARVEPDLAEWAYGAYEGLTSAEIHATRPDWSLFRDGCPGGESPEDVVARVDRLVARLRTIAGPIVVFTHGHLGAVLAARWIGLPVTEAEHLPLLTASIGVLAEALHHPGTPVIERWNATPDGA